VAYDASKDPPKPAEWRCYQVKPKGEEERWYCFADESECKDAHSATGARRRGRRCDRVWTGHRGALLPAGKNQVHHLAAP
jgi:hypothetical protein